MRERLSLYLLIVILSFSLTPFCRRTGFMINEGEVEKEEEERSNKNVAGKGA